jgi:hypothetical protein
MPRYRERFALDISDIDRIERAIRSEISIHARQAHEQTDDAARSHVEIRRLNELLAKIYHQKVFYSQVNATGVPGG